MSNIFLCCSNIDLSRGKMCDTPDTRTNSDIFFYCCKCSVYFMVIYMCVWKKETSFEIVSSTEWYWKHRPQEQQTARGKAQARFSSPPSILTLYSLRFSVLWCLEPLRMRDTRQAFQGPAQTHLTTSTHTHYTTRGALQPLTPTSPWRVRQWCHFQNSNKAVKNLND